MKNISDVIVIGSGIIGASIAFALTRAGHRRVTLVEKGPLASGMTRRSAGLVHPFQPNALLAKLALTSYDFYRQWNVHFGAPGATNKNGFVETGAALLAQSSSDVAKIFAHAQMLAPFTADVVTSARGALAQTYPGVAETLQAGLFTPHAGYADAVQTVQQLVRVAQTRGLTVATGTLAKQILVHGGRVQGIATTTGNFDAPQVIVATGGWAEKLILPLGPLPALEFFSGAVLFYQQPETVTNGHPLFVTVNGEFFLRPHPYRMSAAGVVSAQREKINPDALDESVSPVSTLRVSQFVTQCLAGVNHAPPKRGHTIAYAACADGLPLLGRVTYADGLFVAAGFGTRAFAVAPAVGEMMAQSSIDGTMPPDVLWCNPMRRIEKP